MQIEWRCTWAVKQRFDELLDYLLSFPEGSPEYLDLLEEMRSLPNFPHGYDEDRDVIVPVVTTIRS
jgi:hypothetical protein